MRHWTQDAAYVAALVALTAGLVGFGFGLGWPAVAVAGLSVAALGVLRALEYRKGVQDGLDVREDVATLKRQMTEQSEAQKKTNETAEMGLRLAREVGAVRGRPGY